MNPPCTSRILHSISFHNGLQFSLVWHSPFQINNMYDLLWYLNKWVPFYNIRFWPPPDHPASRYFNHQACSILLSFVVFSLHGMYQTLHLRVQGLGNLLVFQHNILQISRCTRNLPHHLPEPIKNLMESWHCCDPNCELNCRIECNLPAHAEYHLVPIRLIKCSKMPYTLSESAVASLFHSGC